MKLFTSCFNYVVHFKTDAFLMRNGAGTFQHSAATIFNKLPAAVRNTTEYSSFCHSVKTHFLLYQNPRYNLYNYVYFLLTFLDILFLNHCTIF